MIELTQAEHDEALSIRRAREEKLSAEDQQLSDGLLQLRKEKSRRDLTRVRIIPRHE